METQQHEVESDSYANKVTKAKHNSKVELCKSYNSIFDFRDMIIKQVQKEDTGEVQYV